MAKSKLVTTLYKESKLIKKVRKQVEEERKRNEGKITYKMKLFLSLVFYSLFLLSPILLRPLLLPIFEQTAYFIIKFILCLGTASFICVFWYFAIRMSQGYEYAPKKIFKLR